MRDATTEDLLMKLLARAMEKRRLQEQEELRNVEERKLQESKKLARAVALQKRITAMDARHQKWLDARTKKIAALQSKITALCAQRDVLMSQAPPVQQAPRSIYGRFVHGMPIDITAKALAAEDRKRQKREWRRRKK